MIQRADAALRAACGTDITAEMYKPMAKTGLFLRFNNLFQSHFYLVRIFTAIFGSKTQFVADSNTMCIGNNGRMSVDIR